MAGKNNIPSLRADLKQFQKKLPSVLRKIGRHSTTLITQTSTNKYMQFGSANMGPRSPTDTGPLRIVTSRLSRSISSAQKGGNRESSYSMDVKGYKMNLTIGSLVPYAAIHEFGFSGTIDVPAHTRAGSPVRAHQRRVNIKARPYLEPSLRHNEKIIRKDAAERVYKTLKEAL